MRKWLLIVLCLALLLPSFSFSVFADAPLYTYTVAEPIVGDGYYAGYILTRRPVMQASLRNVPIVTTFVITLC